MKIEKIEFKNFKSYGNKIQTFELKNNDLYMLTGKNGFGKTVISEVITYAIYGKVLSSNLSDLPNRINNNLWVKIYLDIKSKKIEIERGINPSIFKLFINGKEYEEFGKINTQEYINNEIVKIPYEIFNNIIVLSALNFKSMLNLKINDKREIVDNILNFDIINKIHKLIKIDKNTIKAELESIIVEINSINESINTVTSKINNIKVDLDKRNLEEIQTYEKQLSLLLENKNKIIHKKDLLLNKINEINDKVSFDNKKNIEYKYTLQDTETKLKLYNNNKCPVCQSDLTNDYHQNIKQDLLNKQKDIQNILTDLNNNIHKNNKDKNVLDSKLVEINNKLIEINNNISINENYLNKIKDKIDNSDINNLNDLIEDFKNKIINKDKNKEIIEKNFNFISLIENIFNEDGIKKLATDKILPIINSYIQKYLIKLNINFNFKFDNKFNTIITSLGEEINQATLSNGEKTRLNFIIILSFIHIIKLRYPTLNLLFLDEFFSSIDMESIPTLVELAKDISKELKLNIILVNHSPLPIELFDKQIVLNKINGFSEFYIEDIS